MKIKLGLFLTGLLLSLQSFASPASELADKLNRLGTLQASFEQHITNGKGRILQESHGSIAIARPGKFRWETSTPMHQLIIADGENIWIYDIDLKQVTVKRLRNANNDNPAMFLSGFSNKIASYFNVQRDGDAFLLTPSRKGVDFQEIYFGFKGDNLERMKMTDSLGRRSDLRFTNVRVNQSVPASKFMMRVPDGIEVIRPKS